MTKQADGAGKGLGVEHCGFWNTHDRSRATYIRDQFSMSDLKSDLVVQSVSKATTNDEALVSLLGA